MIAIARYEVMFTDTVPLSDDYKCVENLTEISNRYQHTLEDYREVLKNFTAKNPTVKELGENGHYPILQF